MRQGLGTVKDPRAGVARYSWGMISERCACIDEYEKGKVCP